MRTEALTDIGVGPWVGPWPGEPELSLYDESLLAGGDRRNVVDKYRYWRHAAIVHDLDAQRHDFHVGVENWGHDFNIGSVIRTANAFNAKAFHIVGKRRWNRRGAMVTDRYLRIQHHPDVEDFAGWVTRNGYQAVGVDNLPGAVPLETTELPERACLIFGSEGPGLTEELAALCRPLVAITQYGSTRSLNAGAAAAIAMYHWALRWA
jgi:tRNA G18 (ribose-2'-O)-methylase SpoU